MWIVSILFRSILSNFIQGYIDTNDDEGNQDGSIKYAMHLIDRVVYKIGEKICMPIFSQILLDLVKMNNWRYRYSALMGLSQVGEYISDVQEMNHVVDFTLNFFKDENPKVRYAALHCIGQFSDDAKIIFQERYTEKVLPNLIKMFSDPISRVVSHVLAAMTNFLDGCTKGSVSNYITEVLEPCIGFLENGISLVKEGAMSTIATLAEATQKDFIPYWERTAQVVFQILKNSTDKKYKQIRGQAIECLVLIGQSVGKEEFKKGAHDIIERLVEIQKNHVDEVDPQKVYLLSGWQRICLILKEDFLPYLDLILPSLFDLIEKIVAQKKRPTGNSNEAHEVINAMEGEKADKSLFHKANTNDSQEVTIAIRMISVFVVELRKGFAPYVIRTSNLLTHLLEKSNNSNVKVTAARGLPGLIKVVNESGESDRLNIVRTMSNNYTNLLWKTIDSEHEPDIRVIYVMVLRELLKASGTYMNEHEVTLMRQNILQSLKESDEAKLSNQELLADDETELDDDDLDAVKTENDNEEEYHCALAELVGALYEFHQELSLPLVQVVYKDILPKVMIKNMSSKMHKFGIFLIDNMIEFIDFDLLRNEWVTLSKILIQFTIHEKAELRHPAAYGIGLLAEKTKENFQNLSEGCLKALDWAIDVKRSQNEDIELYGVAKDNAISALGKIINFQPRCINLKEITLKWLQNLPLRYDKKEARGQHEMVVDIILHSDPALIFGDSGENLPHVIKLFALVVNTNFSSPEFRGKIHKVIEALAGKPETKLLLQEAIGKLDFPLREKLKNLLS